jgi:rod shape-determining protein MreD
MTTLNTLLLLLATVLAVFWEAAFNSIRDFLGAQIDLLPALMVYAGLRTGLVTLSAVAVLGGLLFDTLSANPLGTAVLPLFLCGWLLHRQRELVLRDQPFAQFVLGLAASAGVPAMTVLILLSTGQTPLLGWGSIWQWCVLTLGGGVATLIVFQMFDLLDRKLNYRRTADPSFRPDREIRRGRK